jgi:8-hydroxy-5-deazaflavin:NADPH oxidoreductase
MRVGVLGTGVVGQAIAGKLPELGHEVVVGTRDPDQTLGRQEPDVFGNPPFGAWLAEHPAVRLAGLADAAAHGEVVVNATAGGAALEALRLAGEANLDGKVLVRPSTP